MADKGMTREEVYKMLEEIVGRSMVDMDKQRSAETEELKKLIAYQSKYTRPATDDGETREQKSLRVGRMLRCIAHSKGDLSGAAKHAKELGDAKLEKALGTSTMSGGAVLIEPAYAAEMVDILRSATVVKESGARTLPMDSGILNIKRGATGAVASYRGESTNTSKSEPTFDEINLKARILDVLCPVSNQLIRRAGGEADSFVTDDLKAACQVKMDSTFIRSDGSQDKPKGMLFQAQTANKFNAADVAGTDDGSTVAEITKDLGQAMLKLMNGDLPMIRCGWLFPPRVWYKFFTALDANSNPVWRQELQTGKIYGFPWKQTTSIPTNLTGSGGTKDTEVYFADFFDLLIGETEAMRVSVSDQAAYDPGTGTLVSAFQRGETLIKVELEHDFTARRGGKEVAVIERVRWGA